MDVVDPTMCRLCLRPSDANIMIVLNHNESMVASIMQITTVEVILEPDHIVYMCNDCQFSLDQAVQFRTTCVMNDDTFRKMYAKNSIQNIPHVEVDPISELFVKQESDLEEESGDVGEEKIEPDSSDSSESEDKPTVTEKKRKPRKRKLKVKEARKEMRQVQCQTCGKMISENNLNQHQQIHNPDRPKFFCPHCPRVCYEKSRLKLHINAVHTGEVKYTCDQCGKMYSRPASLRNHFLAIHTDIKKFECKYCGEKFSRSALRHHHYKMVHTEGKPWGCEYCEKSFKMKSDWTIHMRIHTGEKPFKCDICGKTFNKSYNVKLHKKSHRVDEIHKAAESKLNVA